jgi:hypothetical protein
MKATERNCKVILFTDTGEVLCAQAFALGDEGHIVSPSHRAYST